MDITLNTPISEIMTPDPVTVETDTPLPEVERIASSKNIHHIPVLRGGKLAGIISRTDLEKVSFMNDPGSERVVEGLMAILKAENLMTRRLVTVGPGQTLRDAARELSEGSIHALPVVDESGIVGIITSTDLIRLMLREEKAAG